MLQSITSDDGDNDRDDIPAPVELLQSCDQEPGADGTSDAQATTFTSNTRAVLKHLKSLSERKETGDSASSNKDRGTIASLNALLGKKRRLDASRWFFELLVLKSKVGTLLLCMPLMSFSNL